MTNKSSTSSSASSPHAKAKFWYQPNRYDAFVVLSFLVIFVLTILVTLVTFFTLQVCLHFLVNFSQTNERDSEYARISSDATRESETLQRALAASLAVHYTINSFFTLANMTMDYYRDFLPFYIASQVKQPSFNTILIGATVPNASRIAFEQKVRQFGGPYKSYYINARDSSNTAFPANQEIYYPYEYVVPEASIAGNMGYNVGSNAIRRAALFNAAALGDVASSTPVLLSGQNVSGIVTYRWFPNTTFFSNLAFRLDTLLSQGLSNSTLTDYVVQFYETSTGDLWYSTMTQSQNPYKVALAQVTLAQHKAMISAAGSDGFSGKAEARNITVADRTINVVFIPISSYAVVYRKWLALSLSIFMGVVCVIFVTIFIKQLHTVSNKNKVDQKRIAILTDASKKIKVVMERLDAQDSRTRVVLDTMSDMIFVTNKEGKIVTTNTVFDKELSYNPTDAKQLTINDVILNINREFWTLVEWKCFALTSFKSQIPVLVNVSAFDTIDDVANEDGWTYVVVMRNTSDRERLLANAQTQEAELNSNLKIAQFIARFSHDSFRRELLRFAEKIHTEEAVRFLIDVHDYKRAKVDKRAEIQSQIYEKYLRIGSTHQLNISNALSESMSVKVQQSLGDVDLFKDVEELIRGMVVLEVYPRFLQREL